MNEFVSKHMLQYPDCRVWMLDGHEVTRLLVDYAFTIEIWWNDDGKGDNNITITIETLFTLQRDGKIIKFEPEQKETLGPALMILHRPIEFFTAFDNGRLIIRFTDNSEIVVEKNSWDEFWNTFGTGEFSQIGMLCSPHEGRPWGE